MSRSQYPSPWTTVTAQSTSERFWPATPWMPTGAIKSFRAQMELRNLGPNLSVAPGYQVANTKNKGDSGATTAEINPGAKTTTDGDDYYFPDGYTDPTTNTNANSLVRFGWLVKLTSGSTLATARVGGLVEVIRE